MRLPLKLRIGCTCDILWRADESVAWTAAPGLLALVACLMSVSVPRATLAAPDGSPKIYGGSEVPSCGWPTTVAMGKVCTGTLVHPELVVYAGHCGDNFQEVGFGESASDERRTASVEFCQIHPQTGEEFGRDFAFCKLSTPVTDIPIVPILMGCEVDAVLQDGKPVTVVGFGKADNGASGIKREVVTTHNDIRGDEAHLGGDGLGPCEGDSGGPIYVQLTDEDALAAVADNSWRVYGVLSYYIDECGIGAYASMMHVGIEWLESSSGLDLTPCHDADGTWSPSSQCGGFPLDPGSGHGAWPACAGGALSGPSASCGAPYDIEPPAVSLKLMTETASATNTVVVDATSGTADVQVAVFVDDGGGSAIATVSVWVDGALVSEHTSGASPYSFELSFSPGLYVLHAAARDQAGNEGLSPPLSIDVVEPGGESSPDNGAPSVPDSGGKGCSTIGSIDWTALWAFAIGLAALRRAHRRVRSGLAVPDTRTVIQRNVHPFGPGAQTNADRA